MPTFINWAIAHEPWKGLAPFLISKEALAIILMNTFLFFKIVTCWVLINACVRVRGLVWRSEDNGSGLALPLSISVPWEQFLIESKVELASSKPQGTSCLSLYRAANSGTIVVTPSISHEHWRIELGSLWFQSRHSHPFRILYLS